MTSMMAKNWKMNMNGIAQKIIPQVFHMDTPVRSITPCHVE